MSETENSKDKAENETKKQKGLGLTKLGTKRNLANSWKKPFILSNTNQSKEKLNETESQQHIAQSEEAVHQISFPSLETSTHQTLGDVNFIENSVIPYVEQKEEVTESKKNFTKSEKSSSANAISLTKQLTKLETKDAELNYLINYTKQVSKKRFRGWREGILKQTNLKCLIHDYETSQIVFEDYYKLKNFELEESRRKKKRTKLP